MRASGPTGPARQKSLQLSGSSGKMDLDDGWLFETPADLLCPITHELFKDPVINSAGQVYERAAIEHHLLTKSTDPITNAPLPSQQLIPVYTLKSRSIEFREHVAKACVEKACSTRSCEVSVRYLRRAAELVSGLGSALKVPGLCDEVVDFLATHPSNVYDAMALRIFADGLRSSGYIDQASQLYLRLVEYGEDRAQQATALQQCLICVTQEHTNSTSGAPGSPQQQSHMHDKGLLPFLVHFLETQQTFGAADVLELLREAAVPDMVVLQLCEQLLARKAQPQHQGVRGPRSPQLSSSGGGMGSPSMQHSTGGLHFNDLMLHYTRLRFAMLQRQIDMQRPHAAKPGNSPGKQQRHASQNGRLAVGYPAGVQDGSAELLQGAHVVGLHGQEYASSHCGEGDQQLQAKQQDPFQRLARFVGRRRRAVASGLFVAATLLNPQQLAVRALQAGSALLLVYCHSHKPCVDVPAAAGPAEDVDVSKHDAADQAV